MSETVDATDESEDFNGVGRVSPTASYVGTVGFAPPGADLPSAEYLGRDAEFLVVLEEGKPALRLRRLVFQRNDAYKNSVFIALIAMNGIDDIDLCAYLGHDGRMDGWPLPENWEQVRSIMAEKYTPCPLPCVNAQGDELDPRHLGDLLPNRLVRITFVIRHLALSHGHPGDEMDMYLGIIKKVVLLE
ncbi:hypothetical protein BJ165DRAFT_1533906 [Panaeolus papilionaceus]|nr:hypothetical protein BJ165DRAFT_1533906 [Panaeolus papilionaceus]